MNESVDFINYEQDVSNLQINNECRTTKCGIVISPL